MKKYIYILLCALCFTGCNLDLPSEMSLDANNELSSSDVKLLLNGLYESIATPGVYGFSEFGIPYTDILADDLKPVKMLWFQIRLLYNRQIPADDMINSENYPYYYSGISAANTILKIAASTEEQKALARYCRAICYLRLIDIYSAVPLVDESYDNNYIQRSSEEKILKFMVEDLKFAKANAPEFDGTNTVPTREAAQALLARVYRIQGNLTQAAIEAEELINSGKFSLSNDPKGEREKELIMNFATLPGLTSSKSRWGWMLSWNARTWHCFAMADELIELIRPGDRRAVFYDFAEASAREGYIFTNKFKRNRDSELMISRLSEMYLISAEAGNTNRLTEFQTFRNSSLSLDEERRLEFAAEFLRWRELRMKGETYLVPYPKSSIDANPALEDEILN